jgi:hypothetical protein
VASPSFSRSASPHFCVASHFRAAFPPFRVLRHPHFRASFPFIFWLGWRWFSRAPFPLFPFFFPPILAFLFAVIFALAYP